MRFVVEYLRKLYRQFVRFDRRISRRLSRIEDKLDSLLPKDFTLSIKERKMPQTVDVQPGKTYDIAAAAVDADGNSITLKNLDFTPDSWAWGSQEADSDPTDANNALVISTDAPVGGTQLCQFDANGPADEDMDAQDVTLNVVGFDVTPRPFSLVFTVRT